VRLRRVGDTVDVIVDDDGQGFDVDAVLMQEGRGLGLSGMQERAHYLGGHVEFQSAAGRGTRVTVSVPVQQKARYA
jgi:signal transduction histidine kinase